MYEVCTIYTLVCSTLLTFAIITDRSHRSISVRIQALAAHLLSVFGVDQCANGDDQNAFNWAKRSPAVSTPVGGEGRGKMDAHTTKHTHKMSASNDDDDQ